MSRITIAGDGPDKRSALSDALLAEHVARDAEGTMRHSRNWYAVTDRIQVGGLPIVSARAKRWPLPPIWPARSRIARRYSIIS
jgi:hypothetical protein